MDPLFAVVATVAVVSAALVVTRRNPVYSAVWMLLCFLTMAVTFLILQAPFLAAIHVIVYTGAILVLFVFVIMLLNLRGDELGEEYPPSVRWGVAALCVGLFALLASPVLSDASLQVPLPTTAAGYGSVESVGKLLFTTYGLPFELVSLLILVAMFGAMILAKKKLWA
jgi:NADH-quinone oxidoreductase subunit J